MTGYHYIRSEPGLWTVGTGTPSSQGGTDWEPESDHASAREAAARVAYLNGGPAPAEHSEQAKILGEVAAVRRHLDSSMPTWHQMDHRIADGLDKIEQWIRGDAG